MNSVVSVDLRVFKQPIKEVIKHFSSRRDLDKEDLESELWKKILEVLPRFKSLHENDIKPLAFDILRNHTLDELRKMKVRKNLNVKVSALRLGPDDFCFDDLVDAYSSRMCDFLPQESSIEMKDLAACLESYMECQTPRMQKFLTELLNPSADTLEKWEALKDRVPMYRQYDQMPGATLGKLLGIPPILVNKIMNDLRHHLTCYGYGV